MEKQTSEELWSQLQRMRTEAEAMVANLAKFRLAARRRQDIYLNIEAAILHQTKMIRHIRAIKRKIL